ncbi:hypothetical protein SteCoe_4179 [Stentor coeruleus]|uniref:Uncharacterized protein n=1 Tax=Stentor coeruleus TaxID=5963 RepID=A0A1R2CVC6_9CILI|nr:hypothetical protein SteCoe_4179 [Stentor coeruleus]
MNVNTLSITEVKSSIYNKFEDLKAIGKNPLSQLSSKKIRSFLSICTSISIKLLQYDLVGDTLEVLVKASEADKLLCELGTLPDQYWQGRLLLFHSLAFLYYRTSQFKKSLKVLHDGQTIIEAIINSKLPLNPDFNLTGDLLIFMNLWKVKKIKEAKDYLEACKKLLIQISNSGIKSKLSSLSRANLKGLFDLATSGILCYENNNIKGIELCERSLHELIGDEIIARPLLSNFIKKTKTLGCMNIDWVTSKDFDNIVLVTCFLPYIVEGTPYIKIGEKVEGRVRSASRVNSATSRDQANSVPRQRIKINDQPRKMWWNTNIVIQNRKSRIRRVSEGKRVVTENYGQKSARSGQNRIYSPSVGSTISTPRNRRGLIFKAR